MNAIALPIRIPIISSRKDSVKTPRNIHQGFEQAIVTALSEIRGAYSFLFMTEDTLVAARDPQGFRPLCLGELEEGFVVSSETCALDLIDAKYLRQVEPGEVVDQNGESIPVPRAVVGEIETDIEAANIYYLAVAYLGAKRHEDALAVLEKIKSLEQPQELADGVRVARIELGEVVVVLGLGIVGQLAATLSRLAGGMPVIGIDMDAFRLKKAGDRGLDVCLNPGDVADLPAAAK